MRAATSRITLGATTAYNLYDLLTNTANAGICSQQFATSLLPDSVRTIVITNLGSAGEIVYLATAGATVSATHHFQALNNGDQWNEKEENSNGRALSEVNLFASASCVIGVRIDWM